MRFATQIASIILSAALLVGCQTDRDYEIYGEGETTTFSVALSSGRTSLGDKINGVLIYVGKKFLTNRGEFSLGISRCGISHILRIDLTEVALRFNIRMQ